MTFSIKYLLNLVLFIMVTCLDTHTTQAQSLINKAERLYHQHQPHKAAKLYQQIMQSNTSKSDKTLAAKQLAYIEGHLYKHMAQARNWTAQGLKYQHNQSRLHQNLADLEREHRQFTKGKIAARLAVKTAQSKMDAFLANVTLCRIILEEQRNKLKNKQPLNPQEIKMAQSIMVGITRFTPTITSNFKLQLGLALLAQDGSALYQAWRGFFLLAKNDSPPVVMQQAHNLIKNVCKYWKGTPLDNSQAQQLFLGLFKSRLFENAQMAQVLFPIATKWKNKEIKEALAYLDFMQKAQQKTYQFYTQMVLKKPAPGHLDRIILPLAQKLWQALNWSNKPLKFDLEVLQVVLEKKFGAQYAFGYTNGFPCFYGGHSVLDQTKSVSQYGKKGGIRFISLDGIVGNDYTGWYRKNIRVGGWANKNKFVQLRPAYAHNGVPQWSRLTDSIERKKYLDKMQQQLTEDEAIAKKNPYAYLPGLQKQVEYQELQHILKDVKSKTGQSANLQLAFINYLKNLTQEVSIFIHEVRHVIDQNISDQFSATELEYRAKLSEIVLSPYPKYFFIRQVMVPSIGTQSSHGQANLKIIKNLVQWMNQNATAIKGFNAKRPALLQFNLLTETQLKLSLQSLDPLAPKKKQK